MADIQSNININVDTSAALANLKNLQREISATQRELSRGTASNAANARELQRGLLGNINATGQFAASLTRVKSSAESFTNALEKNKLSMGEYFKYAGASSKTFGKLFTDEFNTIEKVARERVKSIATQYIKLGRTANGAVEAISVRPLIMDMDSLATKTAMAAQKQQIFNQLMKQGSTNLLNFGKNTQWAGRQLMVGFTIPLTLLGSEAAKVFMKLEEQAIRFRRVYGESFTATSETEAMIGQVRTLATEFTKYGVAVEKTMELAATAAASGKMGADLLAQVAQATRLAVLGGVEQAEALETTISVTNAFGVATENLAGKIDFLNAVENQTVTSIEDLTIAIPKAGPVVQQLGGDVEDLAFFLTAMKEGGINASEGANALKSGLAALINPTATASKFLESFGVNVKGIVDANVGNVKGLVVDFASALDTLDPLNRARAIEQLFGKFQFSRISTLFKNVVDEGSQAARVLKLSNATTAELAILSERELKRIEDSPVYKFKKAFEDLKVSLAPVGEAFLKAVTPFLEFGTSLLAKFNQLSEGGKSFIVGLTVVLGAIGPVAIMTFGLLANGVAQIIKGFLAVRGIFSRAGESAQGLGAQTGYMTNAQLEAAAAAASLDQVHGKLTQTFGVEKSALMQLTAAYNKAIAAQSRFGIAPVPTTIGKGKKPAKYAKGVSMVPGPKGAGDVVPAMLAPGEAIIPADKARKYSGFIQGMIAGNIPGFEGGLPSDDVSNLKGQTVTTYGNAVQILPKSFMGSNVNKEAGQGKADRSTYMAALKSVGPSSYAPFLVEMASQMLGPKATDEAVMTLATSDKFTDFAKKLSVGVVDGLATGTGLVGDAEYHKLAAAKAAELAKSTAFSGSMGDAANTVLNRDTAYEDMTSKRVSVSSGSVKPIGRRAILSDVPNYESPKRRTLYQKAFETMGGSLQPKDYELSHFQAPTNRGAEDLAATSGKSKILTRALARMRRGETYLARNKVTGKGGQYVPSNTSNEDLRAMSGVPDNQAGRDILVAQREAKAKKAAEISGTQSANARVEAEKKVLAKEANDPVMIQRSNKRNSPHPQAAIDGRDDARARVTAQRKEEAKLSKSDKYASNLQSNYGGAQVVTGQMRGERKQVEKLMAQDRYAARQQASADRAAVQSAKRREQGIASSYGTSSFTPQMRQDRKRQAQSAKQANAASAMQRKADARAQAKEQVIVAQQQRVVQQREIAAQAKSQKRTNLMSKLKPSRGALMGGGMAASTLAMGASMIGGPIGDAANQVMGPVMAISGLMSVLKMLPGPIGIVVAAVGGLAAIFIHLQEQLNSTRKAAQETATAMSSGADSMQSLAEFAGTTTPSEVMNKLRAEKATPYNTVTGKETFGGSYMQSEPGLELLKQAQGLKLSGNADSAASSIGLQLSQAIASDIITKEQAFSIANNLGEAMNDYDFAIDVNSTMSELLGPDGQDLLKDPLAVKVRLIEAKVESIAGPGQAKDIIADPKGSYMDIRSNATEVAGAEIQYAQNYKDIVDMGKQNIDQLELEHTKRLDILQAAGDLAGIEKEKTSYFANKEKLLTANSEAIKAENEYLNSLERSGNSVLRSSARQVVDNLEASLKAQFEGAEQKTKDLANKTIENISNNPSLSFASKATLVATMTVDNMGLFQQVQALFPVDKNPQFWEKIARVSIEMGSGSQDQLMRLLPGFSDNKKADKFTDYVLNLQVTGKPDEAQDALDTMTALGKIKDNQGKPIALDDFVNVDGSGNKKFIKLTSQLKTMSSLFAKSKGKKLTYEVAFKSQGFELSQSEIDYFNSLPADQQKVYTTSFLVVKESIDLNSDAGKARVMAYRKTLRFGGAEFSNEQIVSQMAEKEARERSTAPIVTDPPVGGGDGGGGDQGGGGTKETNPLDAILSRLKQVRDASINAAGGVKELIRVIGTAGRVNLETFTGTEQGLVKANASKGFMDFYNGLDEKAKKTYAKISGRGKDAVVTLTTQGARINAAFNESSIGDFQASLLAGAQENKNRATAFNMLTKAGLDSAKALEVVQNAELALAIATRANKKEILGLVDALKKLEKSKTTEETFNSLYGKVKEKLSADRDKIGLDFDLIIKADRASVLSAEKAIANIQYSIDDLNAGLQEIAWQEEEINKTYDKRFEALDKIEEMNAAISEQQKGQLSLADALSRGDISAAAVIAQEMRSKQADKSIADQRQALEKNKQVEIDSLKSSAGLNRINLEKQLLALEKQVFFIEESKLEPASNAIRLATELRDIKLTALDDEDYKWKVLQNTIDLTKTKATDYADSLAAANKLDLTGPGITGEQPDGVVAVDQTNVEKYTTQVARLNQRLTTSRLAGAAAKTPAALAAAVATSKALIGQRAVAQAELDKAKKAIGLSTGGMVPKYFASGGFARGTDTIPAMLTPGEFVVKKFAVDNFGADNLKAINSGTYSGGSVYNNYDVNINVKSDANANDIARTVITEIKRIDSQRIRGNRFNG